MWREAPGAPNLTHEEALAEVKRLQQLLLGVEFVWGGFCLFCGCHGRHDCNTGCSAFTAPHQIRVGEPPPPTKKPYGST